MSKTDKLLQKLANGSISAAEARTLLKRLGWIMRGQEGSHEQWVGPNSEKFTIATHDKDLKNYQKRDLKKIVIKE